ncbi:MAG: hypothetical protein OZ921_01030 [Sorangiineae bacterium]|nr:hypothetical protein [Polyangiaceae bacterium]MEB2321067.1 hypothetical protein [Sorangiineae bacterium]
MLERVAVHQTRLRVPGVGLDARGVALGARGLVLFPSLDRLIAFLAVYSGDQPLDAIVQSLRIAVVKSKLGTRELTLSFDAGSSDRMDRVTGVARLTGGFVFTGTSRHFVQYRDAAAPFGYDASELVPTDGALALYHQTFTQAYEEERTVSLASLLLRLSPELDPARASGPGPLWVLAEPGLGPIVSAYLARSSVEASVGVVEFPPETSFDDAPVRRFILSVPELPARMLPTFSTTPGITLFRPDAPGVAVELGFRHPITLRSCPVFEPSGLTLFFGRGRAPLVIERVPALGRVGSLGRAALAPEGVVPIGREAGVASELRVKLRLAPTLEVPTGAVATLVPNHELGMLRRLVYTLGPNVIGSISVAVTEPGIFIHREQGIELLPVGMFFHRVHPSVYVPVGLRVVPAVGPDVLFAALGAPSGKRVYLLPDARALALDEAAFAPLESALLEAERWAPLRAEAFASPLAQEIPTVWLGELGLRPLAGTGA